MRSTPDQILVVDALIAVDRVVAEPATPGSASHATGERRLDLVYMTSRPISRFVTGFQIVREPTCQDFNRRNPRRSHAERRSVSQSSESWLRSSSKSPRSRTAASWSSNAGSRPARSRPSAVRDRRQAIAPKYASSSQPAATPPSWNRLAADNGHRSARCVHTVGGRAFAVGTRDRERVKRVPRHLQQDAGADGPAPLVIRMSGDRAGPVGCVVGRLVEMQSAGDLGRAPSLVDAQVADDVRRLVAVVPGGVIDARSERASERRSTTSVRRSA